VPMDHRPLDGTTNYAHGYPWFCVSIALEVDEMSASASSISR